MAYQIKIISLLLIGFWGLISLATAQTDTLKNNVIGGFLIMPVEFPVTDIDALNQQLKSVGLPVAKYTPAAIGIGLQLYTNRFITTLSFNKGTKKSEKNAYQTEVEYRATALNIGYDLLRVPWYSVYPYLGFKGSGLNYYYREKITPEASFENYLLTNLQYKEVTNSRAHLDVGLGISHQWFYLVNGSFGYLFPLEKARWNINNNQTTLTNSPPITYKYYFTLTIGLGQVAAEENLRRR